MAAAAPATELYLTKARDCSNVDECMSMYDKWAASYNDEVGNKDQDYVAPVLVAQAAIRTANGAPPGAILDAGCGTGLVGQALAAGGAKIIDGIDLSPPMLKVAEQTGVYRDLAAADMTRPIDKKDNTYDIITCVGTFTRGHVGPDPGLRELVRVTRPHGIVIATILEEIWVPGGYKAEVEKLKAEGLVTTVSDDLIHYVKGHGDKAILLVLKKTDAAKAR